MVAAIIEIKKTEELSETEICQIIELKKQHWSYTTEEHLRWFKENIRTEDEHLLLLDGESSSLLAYLNLVYIDTLIDNQSCRMIGIGNVCVKKDKAHAGIGSILISSANAVLKKKRMCGVLLCHDKLLKFYEGCGWSIFYSEHSLIQGNRYEHNIMIFDPIHKLSNKSTHFEVDRYF